MMQSSEFSPSDVRRALRRLCSSDLFEPLERLKTFLTYIVEEELNGRGEAIRGKTIAQDVYGRDPVEEGDSDNVVRVDARRLRQLLDHYYETVGSSDPVRIHVDTGGYRPRFERVEALASSPSGSGRRALVFPLLMFVVGAAIGWSVSVFVASEKQDVGASVSQADPNRTLERQAIFDKSPASLQAVNLAEQARGMIFPIFDRPRQQLVSEVFRRVIELDPDYFGGYAGAAQTLGTLAIITPPGAEKDTLLAAADRMSKEAIRLEPAEAWSQSARAWTELANGHYEEAMRLARRSGDLAPEDGNVLDFLGSIALFTGYFEEAVAAAEHGKDKSGSNRRFANRNIFAAAGFHLGNFEASLDAFQSAADYGDPISAPSIAFQAANLNALGRTTEAKRKVEELRTGWPEANLKGMMRGVYQHPEHADEILTHLDQLGWTPPEGPN